MIEIQVTEEDIIAGTESRKNGEYAPHTCPIARASQRVFGPESTCGIVGVGPYGSRYTLPEEARNFIRNFDDGEPVFPFSFTATVPA